MGAASWSALLNGRMAPPGVGTGSQGALSCSRLIFSAPGSASALYPGGVKTFDSLYAELTSLSNLRPDGSGTVALLDQGVHAIGKKIVEEASEVWMAAEHESAQALAVEISQLVYHLEVLMVAKGITPEDVYREL